MLKYCKKKLLHINHLVKLYRHICALKTYNDTDFGCTIESIFYN